MTQTDHYAVFGHPIKHSKSPRIHTLFAQQTGQAIDYVAQDVPPESFDEAIKEFLATGGKGLNCTVPLKELAWQRAENLTQRANLSKAVNTLILQHDGTLLGDNTDGIGLVTDLQQNHDIALTDKRILVLGSGGASRGIISPIMEQRPQCLWIANRTKNKALQLVDEFASLGYITGCGFELLDGQQFDLIINATSASLSGTLPPLPNNLLADTGVCYDLAYANEATVFVRWGQQHAGKSLDGLGMLVEQAAEAFYQWRNIRPDTKPVLDLLNSERNI